MSLSTLHRIASACAPPLAGLLMTLIAACGGGAETAPPGDPLVLQVVDEYWYVTHLLGGSRIQTPHKATATGRIDDHFDPHSIDLVPPQVNPFSGGNVFVNDFGIVYWTSAIAPRVDYVDPRSPIAYSTHLNQTQAFKKRAGNAAMRMVISVMTNELMDSHAAPPSAVECPILNAGAVVEDCLEVLTAQSNFKITAQSIATATRPSISLAHGELTAAIYGYRDHWHHYAYDRDAASTLKYAAAPDFAYDNDVDQHLGDHAKQWLKRPVVIEIPLDGLPDDGEFMVSIELWSMASNMRSGDAFAGAWFHDPQKVTGVSYEGTGIEPLRAATPMAAPVLAAPALLPAPECSGGTDPAAGQIAFDAPTLHLDEASLAGALVPITRTGGSRGDLSVRLTAGGGTARAGVDYHDAPGLVHFADGEQGTRFVRFEPIDNTQQDGNRSTTLSLTELHGCGSLGSNPTVAVTIFDDDQPPPVAPMYAVGGTVSGLTGSGLVLREFLGGGNVSPTNGAFTFAGARSSGSAYEVRVETQPTNPIQVCTVANGVGTIANANVTNVAVTCATPAPNGSLDPSFGNGGKVASNIAFVTSAVNARMGMALQADGRILLVGGLKLARFNSNGTPDTSFGTAGVVAVPFNGSAFDYAQGVAVQTDGRIVVVGTISVGGTAAEKQDFALARFNTDGTLDTSFGIGGMVSTDFKGNQDIARRIVIQSDGKLLVAGYSTFVQPPSVASTSFALARYNVDGSPDTSFASGLGRTGGGFGGTINQAQGLTVQRDGKIVMAGKTASDAGSNPYAGLTRHLGVNAVVYGDFFGAGEYDHYFGPGPDPDVPGAIKGFGQVSSNLNLGGSQEAVDVVEQPGIDGQLLVASRSSLGGNTRFGLATFLNLTDPNTGKVYGGFYPTTAPHLPTLIDFSGKSDAPRAMALQADGKVLMVGMSDIFGANPDMAIARFSPSLQNASIDTTFGIDGKVSVDFFGAIDGAEAVAVQPDGKIIVGGFARNAGTTVFALLRLLP